MKTASRQLAGLLVSYMRAQGWDVATGPYEMNIVYLEGGDMAGLPIPDRMDGWNDGRLLITVHQGEFVLVHNTVATTEPGLSATRSKAAAKRGGVFRIAIGQQRGKWVMGFHRSQKHSALVQKPGEQVLGHRDRNQDGLRSGEPLAVGTGINQHGTSPTYQGNKVGNYSEGCLVGRNWIEHMMFIAALRMDPRYIADQGYAWDTTVIDTTHFNQWLRGVTLRNESLPIAKP
jgi:hypothetical protein